MQKNKIKSVKIICIIFMLFLTILVAVNYAKDTNSTMEINYNSFLSLLNEKQISKVIIDSDNLIITPAENNKEYKGKTLYTANVNDANLISKLNELGVDYQSKNNKKTVLHNIILIWIAPIVIGLIMSLSIVVIIFFIKKYSLLKKENEKLKMEIKELIEKQSDVL